MNCRLSSTQSDPRQSAVLLNANVMSGDVVVPPGATAAPLPSVAVFMVTVGAVWSTVHVNDVTGPVLPLVSIACTLKVYDFHLQVQCK